MNSLKRAFLPRLTVSTLFSILLILSLPGVAVSQAPPEVRLAGTQLLSITSTIVPGQEYAIQVHLPGNYSDVSKFYPIIYVLDGQWDFTLVTALYGQQYYDGFIPASIIVGITWGGTVPSYDSLRSRDLTPSHNDRIPQSGNAPQFLAFIKKELIPFIESKFRTNGERAIMGSSFGGLFTLYAMFHETALFNRYVAASPAIGWNGGAIGLDEKVFAGKNSRLPARLYMVIGEYEDVRGFHQFADQLRSRQYEGFEVGTRVLENTGHSGSKGEGFARGLQYVFAPPSVKVDPGVLSQYAGVYRVNPLLTVTLSVDKGRLMGTHPEGGTQVLHAASAADFYVRGQFVKLHFKRDASGKVTGFQLEEYGRSQFVAREK